MALGTVLFRPFPFEVGDGPALLSSLEGLALLALAALALPRLLCVPGLLLRRPYVAFACLYLLGFAYAFASIENFGILARQRVQVLPLLFVLLAVHRRRVAEPDAQVISA